MTARIYRGSTLVSTPTIWTAHEHKNTLATTVHETLGGKNLVVHRPPAARVFELKLVYATEAAALTMRTQLLTGGTLTAQDTDRAMLTNIKFVPTGHVTLQLDPETTDVWILTTTASEVNQ